MPKCSGHGTCVAGKKCTSKCKCDPGWTGNCCYKKDGSDVRDPHIRTFDGLKYDFQGNCSYVLVQDCIHKNPDFVIIAKHRSTKMRHGRHYAVVHGANILVGNDYVKLLQGREVLVNGVISSNKYMNLSSNLVIFTTDIEVRVKVMQSLEVVWDGDRNLHVSISSKMSGKVCGLLGDDDNDDTDDFIKPDGTMAQTIEEFGNSWLVPGSCNE
ncbi:BMP-binding endothelial regulator protein-like [Saccoglossus kowalevskii]